MPRLAYFVYILASRSRRLYIGVTNDLERRILEHRAGHPGAFTTKYRITRLVYFEQTNDVRAAIAREKQLKCWRREKKLALIDSVNAEWLDLAAALWPGSDGDVIPSGACHPERSLSSRAGPVIPSGACHPERSEGSTRPAPKSD